MTYSSDVAFTPTVKAIQAQRGSRAAYARKEEKGGFRTTITPDLVAFLAGVDSFYLATAAATGQPYIQHRGGPPGFIQALDEATLGFVDFTGNRQYITTGNLADNPQAFIFLMDYRNRRRIKIWGSARVVPADDPIARTLFPAGYDADAEQAILFTVAAWDTNCPQHIPQKFSVDDVAAITADYESRIAVLEARIAGLQ